MLYEVEVDYKAGGYPLPTYAGTHKFTINVGDYEQHEDIRSEAHRRAVNDVARRYVMDKSLIRITDLRLRRATR